MTVAHMQFRNCSASGWLPSDRKCRHGVLGCGPQAHFLSLAMYIYIYRIFIYVYMFIHVYMYIYIYIHICACVRVFCSYESALAKPFGVFVQRNPTIIPWQPQTPLASPMHL